MAARAALLLGVLLATHRAGDAGEAAASRRGSGRRWGDAGGDASPGQGRRAAREPQLCPPPALLEANGNLSCRCAKTTRAFIPPWKYGSVEVRPVGSSCRRPEVV